VVGDDTIKRLFAAIDEPAGAAWVAQASAPIWGALPERFILDWDSTVQTKYGHQEGAARGYNPQKPGRKSFHPLVALGAGTLYRERADAENVFDELKGQWASTVFARAHGV
jgi:hypothetical protein